MGAIADGHAVKVYFAIVEIKTVSDRDTVKVNHAVFDLLHQARASPKPQAISLRASFEIAVLQHHRRILSRGIVGEDTPVAGIIHLHPFHVD